MSADAYLAGALPRRRGRPARAGAIAPLWVAAVSALAMAALWALAEHVYALQVRDTALLRDFMTLNGPHVGAVCRVLLHLLEPGFFVIWGVALVLFAVAGERARVALAVVAVMALAPLSAELLKPLLAHPHVTIGLADIGAASWPSGHATAATALALSAVLVAPARFRPVILVGALAFMLAVGAALLIRKWHLPSDVLGGYLLGVLWVSVALAAVRASERRWPPRVSAQAGATPATPVTDA